MTKTLTGIEMAEGRIPVIHNVDVSEHDAADDIRRALVLQLSQPVRWSDTIEWLIKAGVAQFAECGPGKVLTGLNRRISRDVSTVALSDMETLEETKENWS
jgi:[acyl-carrier-protein] S-malonyltransferase